MVRDLKNLRAVCYYLSKTELKFDLVSAIDELSKQIRMEVRAACFLAGIDPDASSFARDSLTMSDGYQNNLHGLLGLLLCCPGPLGVTTIERICCRLHSSSLTSLERLE